MKEAMLSYDLVERYNRPGPRYTSYPTVPVWSHTFGAADYQRALHALAAHPDEPISLYVHLPFCQERCAYCGCNATVTRRSEVVDTYLDCVERELDLVTAIIGRQRKVVQLHWGGGTPNFLTPDQTRRLFGLLAARFDIEPDGEISVEADPRIGSRERFEVLRELGFNRISLGVQDFESVVQVAIGRLQSADQTTTAYAICRELGFDSVNLDLVYGLPGQTASSFERTLQQILALTPDRIACFSYAHMPTFRPNQKWVDTSFMPTPHEKFEFFKVSIETLTGAGYEWIGMDHFARYEDELAVATRERRLHRNFMGYTTQPASHLLAFGMSSIGDLVGFYAQNDAKLGQYQRSLQASQLPIVRGHQLSRDDQLRRKAINALMCNFELPYQVTASEFGLSVDEAFGDVLERLCPFEDEGFLEFEVDRISVTHLGRFFIRNICMEFDAYLKTETNPARFSKTI
jgi:oxygen-independent coproporphyrinogen-3 oxidase